MFYSPKPAAAPAAIDLASFEDFLRSLGPINSDEKVTDCVEPLRSLSLNGGEILKKTARDILVRDRRRMVTEVADLETSSNSFMMFNEGEAVIRLNVWRPLKPGSKFDRFNGRVYAYGFPHDHDFDLLTVGGFGPGYTTTIFHYDRQPGGLEVGDHVDSHDCGEFTLGHGDVLFYEQAKDIHVQHPAPALSVSINVASAHRVKQRTGQFIFDETCSQIVGMPEYTGARVLRMADLLLEIDREEAIPLVCDLANRFKDQLTGSVFVRLLHERGGMELEAAADLLKVNIVGLRPAAEDWSVDHLIKAP